MGRTLDFIVFGTARSGTTAVAKYLSAAEEIYCGHEVFRLFDDHSKIIVPDAFVSRPEEVGTKAKKNLLKAAQDVAKRQSRIRVYGNKLPIYFMRLQGILNELGNVPATLCYRNPRDIAVSYKRRALDSSDKWPAGRRGLLACGEMMFLVRALANLKGADVLVIPHRALTANRNRAIRAATDHVAPGMSLTWNRDEVAATTERKNLRNDIPRPDLDPFEEEAVQLLDRSGANQVLDQSEPFTLLQVQSRISAVARALPADPLAYVRDLAAKSPDPDVTASLNKWARQINRASRQAA